MNRFVRWGVGSVLALGFAATPLSAGAQPPTGPAWRWNDCIIPVAAKVRPRVRCGTLIVPETRSEPTGRTAAPGRTIELPVVVLAASSPTPRPDPLVFPTNGGPGVGSIERTEFFADWADWASIDRDVILVEQRGDRKATPSLDCPEQNVSNRIVDGRLVPDRTGTQGLLACHDRLVAEGVDLSAYTSAASVADLADLRAALGYDQWNLYGISYGSRLALTVMRDRPEGLRAVILDGVYPPNADQHRDLPQKFARSVDALLAACTEDPECHRSYPNLRQSLVDLLERTEREPIQVTVNEPETGQPLTLEINDQDIASGLFDALYGADTTRALPFVIDQLARGNTDVALPLAQNNVATMGYLTEGLRYSVECAEELPYSAASSIDATASADPIGRHMPLSQLPAICGVWQMPALGPVENEPVRSDIPTLILNGARDPVTPPSQGALAATTLGRHYLYTFPTMGHGSAWESWFNPCPGTIAREFLADPNQAPDASCIAATPSTRFLTTTDIHPTAAIYRLNRDVIEPRPPVTLGLLALAGVVFAAGAVGSVVGLVRRRSGVRLPALALTTGALNLGFAGALYAVLASTDQLILGFGLPPSARWLSLLPVVAVIAAAALLVAVARGAVPSGAGPRRAIPYVLVAVAGLAFAGWLFARGLLIL